MFQAIAEITTQIYSSRALTTGTISVGKAINIGHTSVETGDLIIGDDDGAVILPRETVEPVLQRAQLRVEKETRMMSQLNQGATTLELLQLTTDRDQS